MKNILLPTLLLLSFSMKAQQAWEASFSTGYLTNGSLQFVEGFVDIGNAPTFQFNFGVSGDQYRDIEVEYKITPGQRLDFRPNPFLNSSLNPFYTHLTTHTFGINGVNYFNANRATRPYGIFGMYAAIFDFDAPGARTRSSAAFRFGIGVKHYFGENLGVKAQVSYNAPVQFSGAGIYAGIGTGGASVGLSLNNTVLYSQGDFLLGIVYKF